MMSILNKENLSLQQKENKVEVIRILETFLKQSNSKELSVPTSDQEVDGFSWLGWTVVNGTTHDVKDLISSKLPPDPLMGMSKPKQYKIRNIKFDINIQSPQVCSDLYLEKFQVVFIRNDNFITKNTTSEGVTKSNEPSPKSRSLWHIQIDINFSK